MDALEVKDTSGAYEAWALVEVMGHRRLAGKVTEVNLFGSKMMRVEIPEVDGIPAHEQILSGSAIFAFTPVGVEAARALAATIKHMPFDPWLLAPSQRPLLTDDQIREAISGSWPDLAPHEVTDEDVDDLLDRHQEEQE